MGEHFKIHMVSPPVYVSSGEGKKYRTHTVFGWWESKFNGKLEPVVANPDGPGIGRWSLYYGEDPWTAG